MTALDGFRSATYTAGDGSVACVAGSECDTFLRESTTAFKTGSDGTINTWRCHSRDAEIAEGSYVTPPTEPAGAAPPGC